MTPVKSLMFYTQVNSAGKLRLTGFKIDLSNPEFIDIYQNTYTIVKNMGMRIVFPAIFTIGHNDARSHARNH